LEQISSELKLIRTIGESKDSTGIQTKVPDDLTFNLNLTLTLALGFQPSVPTGLE